MVVAKVDQASAGVISVSGTIDVTNAVAVRVSGERLLAASQEASIEVDLASLEQSGSVAISVMLCWMRLAKSNGKTLEFTNMPNKMFDVARVSGLDEVIPLRAESSVTSL